MRRSGHEPGASRIASEELRAAPCVAVAGVIVDSTRRVLLVRRAASSVEPLTWAFPGGTPEFGEPLPAAVEREVREETGLSVTVGDVFWVGDLIDPAKPPGWHYAVIDFRCRVTGGVLRAGDDAIEARWVPLGDVHTLELAQAMREVLRGIGASC